MKKHSVLILGYSFVKGLNNTSPNKRLACQSNYPTETFVLEFLHISKHINQIYFEDDSGACIMDDFRLLSFLLRNIKPSIVIIDIVSNDIAHNYSTASICAAIIDTARILKDKYHVKHIKICSCIRRERNIGKLSSSQFNDLTIALNNKLSIDTKNLTGISYHTNKGFWGKSRWYTNVFISME